MLRCIATTDLYTVCKSVVATLCVCRMAFPLPAVTAVFTPQHHVVQYKGCGATLCECRIDFPLPAVTAVFTAYHHIVEYKGLLCCPICLWNRRSPFQQLLQCLDASLPFVSVESSPPSSSHCSVYTSPPCCVVQRMRCYHRPYSCFSSIASGATLCVCRMAFPLPAVTAVFVCRIAFPLPAVTAMFAAYHHNVEYKGMLCCPICLWNRHSPFQQSLQCLHLTTMLCSTKDAVLPQTLELL